MDEPQALQLPRRQSDAVMENLRSRMHQIQSFNTLEKQINEVLLSENIAAAKVVARDVKQGQEDSV